jgi:carboxyl-terminal processing protease
VIASGIGVDTVTPVLYRQKTVTRHPNQISRCQWHVQSLHFRKNLATHQPSWPQALREIHCNPTHGSNTVIKNFCDHFRSRLTIAVSTLQLVALSLAAQFSWAQSGTTTVVEYKSKAIGNYFMTGRADEKSLLDSFPDLWERTGMQFQAFAGTAPDAQDAICRFQLKPPGTQFSSHFYGGRADCALVASQNRPDLYIPEGIDFGVALPTGGVCPANAPVPVYRSFRGTTPVYVLNHRYSVSQAQYNDSVKSGYTPDAGLVFCVISATPANPLPTFAASRSNEDKCVAPRVGSSPYTGRAYPDTQGTLDNERNWMRSWIDETYLWYRDVPNLNVASFSSQKGVFDAAKTPYKAFIGKDKDEFHFSQTTDSYEQSRSGTSSGYGVSWKAIATSPPRKFVASVVTPGSPAALAGVARGDEIVSIDGENFVSGNNVAVLNAGLFPSAVGQTHTFVLRSVSGVNKNATLTSATVASRPVTEAGVITTPTGRVGYIAFQTFGTNVSESALVSAFSSLATQGLNDLVLDLRYNGGGFLDISAQLGYMIAGPSRTAGKTYELVRTNDKKPFGPDDVTPFHSTTLGFSLSAGQALPTLNLGRVYILTSASSCSASEALINGLRGVDVEVNLVGSTTCGKPYGFFATDNCGTTFFSVQFDGLNHKGVGEYIAGFSPTCAANDDLTKTLGDPMEKQLNAALTLRSTGVCAPVTSASSAEKSLDAQTGVGAAEGAVIDPNSLDFGANNRLVRAEKPAFGVNKSVAPMVVRDLGVFEPATSAVRK